MSFGEFVLTVGVSVALTGLLLLNALTHNQLCVNDGHYCVVMETR